MILMLFQLKSCRHAAVHCISLNHENTSGDISIKLDYEE
jgi:hypothetical protein